MYIILFCLRRIMYKQTFILFLNKPRITFWKDKEKNGDMLLYARVARVIRRLIRYVNEEQLDTYENLFNSG